MTNEHYSKYKETIKKVARRNYRKRVAWLNNHLADEYCQHCAQYTPFDNNNCGSTVSQKLLRKQPPSPILFLRDLHPSSFFTKIEIRGPPRI